MQNIPKLKGNVALTQCFIGGDSLCLLSPGVGSSVVGCLQQMSNEPPGSSRWNHLSSMQKILWHGAKHIKPMWLVRCCESLACSEWKHLFRFYLLVYFNFLFIFFFLPAFVSRWVCTARVIAAVLQLLWLLNKTPLEETWRKETLLWVRRVW